MSKKIKLISIVKKDLKKISSQKSINMEFVKGEVEEEIDLSVFCGTINFEGDPVERQRELRREITTPFLNLNL